MVWVPLDGVDSKVMVLVCLQVQLLAALRAQMDLTLFGTDQEKVRLVFVKVEAHAAGKTVDKWLFFAVSELLLLVNDKLELDDLLRLQFVLHQVPQSHAAI